MQQCGSHQLSSFNCSLNHSALIELTDEFNSLGFIRVLLLFIFFLKFIFKDFFFFSGLDGTRCSADEMDEKRAGTTAYEYLCRLEETKKWMESCIGEILPESIHLEEVCYN